MCAKDAKDLQGQKKFDDVQYPASQPASARVPSVKGPKLSERERFILTQVLQASKACKSIVKQIRAGNQPQPQVVSAASVLAAAYGQMLLGDGS